MFCARTLLRAGVSLLGLRITTDQVLALGWGPLAMLLPVIVLASALTRAHVAAADPDEAAAPRPPLLPGFAVTFALLVAINSTGVIPPSLQSLGAEASRWLLVAAIAGIGMKTQLRELAKVGWRPVLLMMGETVFLAALAIGLVHRTS